MIKICQLCQEVNSLDQWLEHWFCTGGGGGGGGRVLIPSHKGARIISAMFTLLCPSCRKTLFSVNYKITEKQCTFFGEGQINFILKGENISTLLMLRTRGKYFFYCTR